MNTDETQEEETDLVQAQNDVISVSDQKKQRSRYRSNPGDEA